MKATDECGWVFVIEVQIVVHSSFAKRAVFYACEAYTDQLRAGQGYSDLKATYSICLLMRNLFKNAGEHTVEEIRELFPGLEFPRATGELNAIREITEEKQMYDAREKASLDIQSNLIDARQEGIEIGEQRGKPIGSVQVLEGLLEGPISPDELLSKKSIEDLTAMVTQLQKRLRDRTSWPRFNLLPLMNGDKNTVEAVKRNVPTYAFDARTCSSAIVD